MNRVQQTNCRCECEDYVKRPRLRPGSTTTTKREDDRRFWCESNHKRQSFHCVQRTAFCSLAQYISADKEREPPTHPFDHTFVARASKETLDRRATRRHTFSFFLHNGKVIIIIIIKLESLAAGSVDDSHGDCDSKFAAKIMGRSLQRGCRHGLAVVQDDAVRLGSLDAKRVARSRGGGAASAAASKSAHE